MTRNLWTQGASRLVVVAGITAMVAGGAGLAGCSKKADSSPPVHASLVNYAVAKQASAPMTITGTGTISAWQEAPVGAEVGGLTAVALLVDEGQSVKQGQPLLKMDDVLLQAQYKQAEAQANQAQKAYDRSKQLFAQSYLSQAALDTAEATQQTTQAALQTARTNLALATVRAPVAGIITERKAVLGQIVQPGAELFKIVRDGRIELNMQVVEADLHNIHPGMAVTVTSSSTGPVQGSVRIVTPMVDPSTRLGVARVSVPWSSGLRPGMFGTGTIQAGEQNVLTVPQAAIVYSENQPAVLIVGPDSRVQMSKVLLGDHIGNDVVIKQGAAPGDKVVTTGAGFLNSGDSVKLAAQSQIGGE